MKRPSLKTFTRDRRGNFALIFGLSLIPLLGFTGLATDYAKSILVKRRLDLAIDSASLAAVRRAADSINDGRLTKADAVSAGEREGRAYLTAQSARIMDASLLTTTVTLSIDGATIASKAKYEASVPAIFSKLFGLSNFQVQGRSGASTTLPPFVDVHVLVDISQSMGIGATSSDQDRLTAMPVRRFTGSTSKVTANGCAFGCHIVQSEFKSNSSLYPTKTTYEVAHENGIRMRIDVVRDALQKLAKSLLSDRNKRYRLALYTFHSSYENILPLTDDATKAATVIAKLEPSTREGGTNAHTAFRKLNLDIATPGDGGTQTSANAVAIVMTDGTEDNQMEYPDRNGITKDPNFVYYNPYAEDWGGRVQSFNPATCKPLKDRKIRLIAMNTKYLIPKNADNPKFVAIRDWLYRSINSNIEACVSSKSDYYDASSPEDIDLATSQIISSISRPLALTE